MSRRSRSSSPFSLFAFQDIITSVTGIMILVTMMLALELLERKEQSPEVKTNEAIEQVEQVTSQIDEQIAEIEAQLNASSEVLRYDKTTLNEQITELTSARQQMESEVQRLRNESVESRERHEQITQQEQSQEDTQETLTSIQDEVRKTREQLQRLKRSNRMIFNPTEGDQKSPWLVELDAAKIKVAKVGESARPQEFATVDQFLSWSSRRSSQAEYFVLLIKPASVESFADVYSTLTASGFDVGYDVMPVDQTAIDPETGAAP